MGGAYENCNVSCPTHKDASTKIGETSLVLGKSFENILSTMYEVLVISGQVYYHPRD